MGYSWYRTDSAYHRHPKMLALKAALNEPLADAYVSRLWSWTQVYASDGRFSADLVAALESELGWTGSSGSLAAALEKTGWLDRSGDVLAVHDWPEYQGYLVKKAKKDADKKRKRRARESARTAPSVRADGAAPSPRTAPPTDVTDGRNERTDGTKKEPARSRVLSDRLLATFLEKRNTTYRFASTVDGPALARLLKLPVTDDEIDRRWRIGLDGKFAQTTHTIAQLDSKWNALAAAESQTSGPKLHVAAPSKQPRHEGKVIF